MTLTRKKRRSKPPVPSGHYIALALVLLVAIFFRIQFNNVAEYSRADETFYTNYARAISEGGPGAFAGLVQAYLNDPGSWLFPHPARWGYILLAGIWMDVLGQENTRALASLSTLAGIVAVLLTYLLGIEFLPRRAALLAAAFTVTSPIQLAMGRRALQEEVHAALILLSFWLFVRVLKRIDQWDRRSWGLFGLAILTLTFTLAVKESTLFVLPAFLVTALMLRGWKVMISPMLLIFALPPALYFAGFLVLGGSLSEFFQIISILQGPGVLRNPYVPMYQSGPPHRVLIDFLALAPIICLVATAAIGRLSNHDELPRRRQVLTLTAATVSLIVVFCILPSKNSRNFTMGDPFIRLLAAWGANDYADRWKEWGSSVLAVLAISSGIAELWIFQEVFINQQVYDPVTDQLFRALRMLPR